MWLNPDCDPVGHLCLNDTMSLSVAQYTALSALMTTQTRIGVTSSNIANANTAAYTKKTATQTSTVAGGMGTGTAITGITSNVDR